MLCVISTGETFALVSWPDEDDCVSVVSNRSCVSGQMVVGEMCEVVERKKKYSTRVHATGIHMVVQCE